MNKNRLGFAWLLLTLIMVGMSLSPMVDNNVLQASETVDSTEIVVDQNDDFEQEKSKDWSQEEQMNNEDEGETMVSDTLIPQSSMDNTLSRDSGSSSSGSSGTDMANTLPVIPSSNADNPTFLASKFYGVVAV